MTCALVVNVVMTLVLALFFSGYFIIKMEEVINRRNSELRKYDVFTGHDEMKTKQIDLK